ncbi:MAG: acetyl-CoA carboxylase biotin carboxylase subunit [Bacteroidales bacterium]|nr:acetyl-CoA carboxylase biotin carboxylase subunit [Bacteroidales bacterium]NPV36578.1 acetyl-CoA carboxylase biotin carboxylase subunit [Bacteroidales bacterium]
MIRKVLVANRGEIAIRVMRSCREMNIRSVAVFSEADRASYHVRYADEAYCIGPAPSVQSYLNKEKIIQVALETGCDAVHPGYGFLSENADFARMVKEAGLIFIGPSPEAIEQMGDKITARKRMIAAGVPVVPGTTEAITNDEEALRIIRQIELPVMIKASAGGGGKGMRLVHHENEIESSLRAARSEAKAAFGDDAVYIEKYISSPHHIEFQILGDHHGNIVHLFERECSVQRRHQKVVEETPSPNLTPEVREAMGKHAVAAAAAVNYFGAGTIEFIMDDQHNYYFLEMNTRLQVEHPITERVVGVDLVKLQIQIAEGKPLPFRQEDLRQNGHAIECRIYAEDPANNFMPSPGKIKHITEPLGLGVRHDGYVYPGYEIPMYYDPMISKLIVWGTNREEAIARMRRALYAYKISGVSTSIPFLEKVMQHPVFIKGNYNTHFIDTYLKELLEVSECDGLCEDVAVITAFIHYLDELGRVQNGAHDGKVAIRESRWKQMGKSLNLRRN